MNVQPSSSLLMYRLLIQSVKEYAIYMLDSEGTVLNWNAGAQRAKGYAAEEIVGKNYACFYSLADQTRGIPARNLQIALRDGHLATEGWRYRKDGTAFWASVMIDPIFDDVEKFIGFVKVTRDLTEQRQTAQMFYQQARHDALTGVANRFGLVEILEEQIPQVVYGSNVAVHYVDLDRFKAVNDALGHLSGDAVLKVVAKRLELIAGNTGKVGRLGGDEFAVLQFGSPTAEEIGAMAEAVIAALNKPIIIDHQKVSIGASIGIAVAPQDGFDTARLMRCADLALYSAKDSGRNCARFFAHQMDENAQARSVMEENLRHAVERKDFRLVYQPIVNATTEEITGYEALLRWQDAQGNEIAPSAFVPLAEELGLMSELGEWVMRNACTRALLWTEAICVSVNLSAMQIADPAFISTVDRVLAETGFPPSRLEFEITETSILKDMATARMILAELRVRGIGVALDDFGTGFSSLTMVSQLPLTRIKIDKSFVEIIDDSPRSTAVVDSVVSLCAGYGLHTTAEGVETDRQRRALVERGCDDLQGFLFGQPTEHPET